MSIKIRKEDTEEVFDLPPDYIIEGERNNPLFEKKGSQTTPVSFPASGHNNRLLDFPFRLDKTYRKIDDQPVIVDMGSFQQRGLLSVDSAGKDILSANIGFDESEMYAKFSDMQLKNIPDLPEVSQGGATVDARVNSMLAHLTAVMKEQTEAEYFIFQVIVHSEKIETTDDDGTSQSVWYYEILNELDEIISSSDYPYGKLADLKALVDRKITRYENGEKIELMAPKGYGVSPFLKVYRILEFIFGHFGLEVTENPFKEDRQLKKLAVLNNTMDTVLSGILHYRDMMPDITIQEFLEGLYAKFGMLYFVDSNTRTVRLKFIRDVVAPDMSGSVDFDLYKTESHSISFSEPRQLRLKMNRKFDKTKTLYDTFEEFLEKFDNQFTEQDPSSSGVIDYSSQLFNNVMCTYFIRNIFDSTSTDYQSSDFFDWDKKTPGVPYEDIEMTDVCVSVTYESIPKIEYPAGLKHSWSEIVISGETRENITNPACLAFVFAWGLTAHSGSVYFNGFYASPFNRDYLGRFLLDENGDKYDISLTCNREDGLYNRFWKAYDAFIRHSNQEVTCNFQLDDLTKLTTRIYETVFLDNQPLLLKQLKYKLNQRDSITECVFRTLRLYKPYDLENEQKIPVYERQKYCWTSMTVEFPDPPTDNILHITREPENYLTINGEQVPITHVSFLPPTEEQFLSGEQRIHKTKITYFVVLGIRTTVRTETYSPRLIPYN